MTIRAEQCGCVWLSRFVSREGFERKTTAGCGDLYCLNGGVHRTAL
jgi:hypothetical protein